MRVQLRKGAFEMSDESALQWIEIGLLSKAVENEVPPVPPGIPMPEEMAELDTSVDIKSEKEEKLDLYVEEKKPKKEKAAGKSPKK